MKDYTSSGPVFSPNIKVVEATDPAHADNINAASKQLLQNDLVLSSILNPDLVEAAFEKVFPGIGAGQQSEAMTERQIEEAINAEWNGESSDDPDAMSSEEVIAALSMTWDGEASTDPSAMDPEQISEAIAKT